MSLAALVLALAAGPLRAAEVEVYVPVFTYHPPYAYSRAQREALNDFPAGAGLGLGRYNAAGNWEGVVAMEFSDSHRRPQYTAAYSWRAIRHPWSKKLRVGGGYLAGVTARSDIGRYTPIPGALPVASIGFGLFDLEATYVPGLFGTGNVAFSWIKIALP